MRDGVHAKTHFSLSLQFRLSLDISLFSYIEIQSRYRVCVRDVVLDVGLAGRAEASGVGRLDMAAKAAMVSIMEDAGVAGVELGVPSTTASCGL